MPIDADELRQAILACKPTDEKRDLAARSLEELTEQYDSLRRYERAALALLPPAGWDWQNCSPTLLGVRRDAVPLWRFLRKVVSRAPYPPHPGRTRKYWVMDRGAVVGIVELADGTLVNAARERWVGWNKDERALRRRYCVDMSTCVAIQPFGTLTGGKCAAILVATADVESDWSSQYRMPLAAVITTSLYGKGSQYNRARGWEYIGLTQGVAHSHVPAAVKRMVWHFAKQQKLRGMAQRDAGGTIGQFFTIVEEVCRNLGVKLPRGALVQRGTYVAMLHDNARGWLCDGLGELHGTAPTIGEASAFWQTRWRNMRYAKKADELAEYDPQQYRLRTVMDYLQEETKRPPDRGTLANEDRQCEPDPAAPDIEQAQDVT